MEIKNVASEKFKKDMEYIMKDCEYWLSKANFPSTAQVLYYVLARRAFNFANPKEPKQGSNQSQMPF
jgi:hypothetical protein